LSGRVPRLVTMLRATFVAIRYSQFLIEARASKSSKPRQARNMVS
jgi:hypothetical protein